jgi:hypothetical protein
LLARLSELMWPCIWIASGLLVVRELHTSALSENVNTAFKNRPDDRNALPVCNAIRFNLNQPFAIDETLHLDEGGGRPDCGKKLAMRTGSGFPLGDIGQHDSRPHHSVEGKASVHHSIPDNLKATSRLAIDVAGTSYASVCRDRRSA